jgi:hypothetical protein
MDFEFLRRFDGTESNTVFCTWTGGNAMSQIRFRCFLSIIQATNCPVAYLHGRNMATWQHPEHPFHPAFQYLSATHKADYLRCYLMHHYGGGYTDIKLTRKDWSVFFTALRSTQKLALGYTEIGPEGVAAIGGEVEEMLKREYQHLIGLGAYIFRRGTELTHEWYEQVNRLLDAKLPLLAKNPAQHPRDVAGALFEDGSRSAYPLQWSELLGNILHPTIYKYKDNILHADIAPDFTNYR